MKKTVLVLLGAVTMGLMMVSCGSGSTGKSNKVLGKVVSLMQDEENRKDKLEAKAKECKDLSCLGKLADQDQKDKEAYKENLKKEIESLNGQQIPTEVKDMPVKVSVPATITKMNGFKRPNCDMELELTKDLTINSTKETFDYLMMISFIDSEGNSLGNTTVGMFGDYKIDFGKVIPAGTKFKHSFDLLINKKNLEKWQNFEKLVLEFSPKTK